MSKIFLWVTISIFIITFIIVVSAGLLAWYVFVFMFLYAIFFLLAYLYLMNAYENDKLNEKDDLKEKKTFDYCWKKTNELLRNMVGGASMTWAEGFGGRSEVKYFYDRKENKPRPFRAMYGLIEKTGQYVVIIFDIEKEDIAKYHAAPSPQIIADPFFEFDPFDQKSLMKMYGYQGRFGRSSRHRRNRGVSINIGGDDEEDLFDPPQSVVDSAVSHGENNGR